jgi:hypothetical protein
LFAIDSAERLGVGQVGGALREAGFACTLVIASCGKNSPETWHYLAEVEGYLAADDPRIGRLRRAVGETIERIVLLGGYAIPLSAEALGRLPAQNPEAGEQAAAG